jgi:hypothetical protein
MKSTLYILLAIAFTPVVIGDPLVRISVQNLGDSAGMHRGIQNVLDDYSAVLRQVRNGLRTAVLGDYRDLQSVINPALQALDALIDQQDVSQIQSILPFIDWLNTNQSHPIAGILGDSAVQGTLNYLVDGIFTARMMGAPDAVSEQDMEAMIRFYAGNPAQTSEGSWQTNNTMLFVFGDRVLNTLAKKAPDRIDAFYKAVLDARKSAQSGPGPDEEEIPDADRPTADQLRAYEATFVRLEALVATGTLPKADLPSQIAPTQTLPLPQAVPAVQQPPKQSAASSPSPTRSEEPTSSTPWSVIVILMAAAIGLAWLLLKKRK